jgi:peptidylprolyl isomerase
MPRLAFTPLPGADGYGEAGHSDSWPAVRARGEAWLAHCYAMVGVGRGDIAGSGSGAELYAVIGHAPRHLDRNITLAGRVVQGIEHLSALPRGAAALGFYDKPEQRITIRSVRLASELPAAERPALEVLRSGTPAWSAYVAARANRTRDGWFTRDAGHVDLCNIRVPVRAAEAR